MNAETNQYYKIRIAGTLESDWADWFEGMTLTIPEETPDETHLMGYVRDQAALYGLLNQIRDLNLQLLGVEPSQP